MKAQERRSSESRDVLPPAAVEPAFRGLSRTATAFLIWRVQNLQIVAVPKEQYGTFYDGDSYIVYAASEYGKHVGPNTKTAEVKTSSPRLEMHIHFWLGGGTTGEDSALAAYKSLELDSCLCGGSCRPVQHREVRGSESPRFKAYFKAGLRILLGGYDPALRSSSLPLEPRLFVVKGRRRPLLTQLPGLAWEYFNSGEVFLIDTKDVVFCWIGRTSNAMERLLGAKVASQLRDEHSALSVVFVEDGKEMELPPPEQTLLGFYLDLRPLAKRVMGEASSSDEKVVYELRSPIKLYHCSDADGIYRVTQVKNGTLNQADLDPKDSYIIDNGPYHIWVWIGREAATKERSEAIRNAHGFLKKKNYPDSSRVSRVLDGGEPPEFKALFPTWVERELPSKNSITNGTLKPGSGPLSPLSLSTLEKQPSLAAAGQLLDDGSGQLRVWRVGKSHLEELNTKYLLYSSEVYYISYKYRYNGENKEILYQWIGSSSGELPKKTILTLSQEDPVSGATVSGRIHQNLEPPHFLTAFQGRLVLLSGEQRDQLPLRYLLQIQGNQIYNSCGKQKPLQKSSLNSAYVYLLRGETESYLWCGRASTGDEREVAKSIARTLVKEFSVIFEGQEKEEFWRQLGGEDGPYSVEKETKVLSSTYFARFFHCLRHKKGLLVDEIMDFSQSDLSQEDVFLLDAGHSLLVWIGARLRREERLRAFDTASEYLRSDPAMRDSRLPVLWTKQGFEPPLFTGFFPTWDPHFHKNEQKFEDLRDEIDRQKPVLQVDLIVTDNIPNFYECEKYPVNVLMERDPEKLPSGVDVQHKEMYLTSEDFFDVFSMKYSDFADMPKWKQEYLKKSVGLF